MILKTKQGHNRDKQETKGLTDRYLTKKDTTRRGIRQTISQVDIGNNKEHNRDTRWPKRIPKVETINRHYI